MFEVFCTELNIGVGFKIPEMLTLSNEFRSVYLTNPLWRAVLLLRKQAASVFMCYGELVDGYR